MVGIVPVKYATLVFCEEFNGINLERLDGLDGLVRWDR